MAYSVRGRWSRLIKIDIFHDNAIAWFPGLRHVCFKPYKLKRLLSSSLHSFWTHLAIVSLARAFIIQPLQKITVQYHHVRRLLFEMGCNRFGDCPARCCPDLFILQPDEELVNTLLLYSRMACRHLTHNLFQKPALPTPV